MQRFLLKSKIHRAIVTDANLHYEGSITIDQHLMEAAGLVSFERVDVYNVENGQRLQTYVIPGPWGGGDIIVNGAAARLVHTGDRVIICSYAIYESDELEAHAPVVVHVDQRNTIVAAAG
jgi:aspartate 1-decarboxylase